MTTTSDSYRAPRTAGVLLHPSSLPSPYGIGDLGPSAYAWVDALVRAKQTWWQILPLGPTGFGDSPYQSFSAFAGNPNLISPELLVQDGLLAQSDVDDADFPAYRVDYGAVIDFKDRILDRAWENFQAGAVPALRPAFEEFCTAKAAWLDDYALFAALKEAQEGKSWQEWPKELVVRQPAALERARQKLLRTVGLHKFRQFLFARQWTALNQYAHNLGRKFIGDVPIFVASDSADVWANPELFLLNEQREPTVVAGVPPDYFSATGQLWGNPLYDWEALRGTEYAWWQARLRRLLEQVDVIRLDHFRGFEAYWEVPADRPTAEVGRWVKAPGADLFATLKRTLGSLPLIAENLGLITPEVEALREQFELPGMRVLHFAFGSGPDSSFLPHNYVRNTVVYTGTHDNDTTRGWFATLSDYERDYVRRYLARDGHDIAWDLVRLAWSSVADMAIAPLQDVLNLGSDGRMNSPGQPAGNWGWRFTPDLLTDGVLDRLGETTQLYAREAGHQYRP